MKRPLLATVQRCAAAITLGLAQEALGQARTPPADGATSAQATGPTTLRRGQQVADTTGLSQFETGVELLPRGPDHCAFRSNVTACFAPS